MRVLQLALAVVALVGLLAGVWFSIRTEPAQAQAEAAVERPHAQLTGADELEAQTDAVEAARASGAERSTLGSASSASSADEPARKKSGFELTGRVVDREGHGVAGADVYAANANDWVSIPLDVETEGAPRNWIEIEHATSDPSGAFVLRGLKPGALRLAARAAGFAPRSIEDGIVPDDPPRTVPDIVLDPGVVLTGRVVDPAGNGVRGATLLAALDGSRSGQKLALPGRGVPVGQSGENGEFRVDRIGTGPWHVIVDSPDHLVADARGETHAAGEEVSGLVIRLESGSEIEGRIQWGSGSAPADIATVRVSARPSPEQAPAGAEPVSAALDPIESRPRHAIADDSGRFLVRGLIAGMRYRLTAAQPAAEAGHWKTIASLEPVFAFAGERGVQFSEHSTTSLSFRAVDDASSAPLTALVVSAGVGRERLMRDDNGDARTDFPDGRVRVPDLRAASGGKPICLRVSAQGYKDYVRGDIAFAPGADVELGDVRLVRERVLVVSVVDDQTGAPIEDARVLAGTIAPNEIADYFASPSDSDFHGVPNLRFGRTGPDGRARLSSYPGVSVNVAADAPGYRASDARSELLPVDTDHALELRLIHGGRVSVRVADPSGRPLAKIGIAHVAPGGSTTDDAEGRSFWPAEYTNALGVARFDALTPGTHSFRTCDGPLGVPESGAAAWVAVTVADRVNVDVALTATARARFFGRVSEGGTALVRARLRLVERRPERAGGGDEEPDEAAFDAVTDRDGRFEFESVRAAQYDLWIAHSTRRMAERFPLTLLEGDNTDEFDLGIASIEGRVVDADGQPMPRVDVSVGVAGDGGDEAQLYDMEMREDDRGNVRVDSKPTVAPSAPTDEQGRYHLRGLRSGESLVVTVRGETVETTTSEPLSLGPGEIRRGVDLAVRRAGAIELSLVGDPPGGQREWFEARIESVDGAVHKTDRRTHLGAFLRTQRVRALGPGRYRVRLFPMGNEASPRAQTQEVEVAAGAVTQVAFQAH